MRAAVLRNGSVQVRTIDDPKPGPGQLLVRSLACGICASDLHFMDHPDAEDDSGMSTYDQDVDIVMGHEYCAELVDYGPNTERRIPLGTRLSSLPVISTPSGRKIIGQNPETPGGFGEYFLLEESSARVIESALPSELVCIADAMAVGWSAALRADVSSREVPLVVGCGAIGLSVIAALARMGVAPIIAVDLVAARRETARAMGAHVVLGSFQDWREHTTRRASVVFECVGAPGVLDSIIKGCERGTRIFSMGGPPEGELLHTLTAKRKGLNMQFGGGPLPAHWDQALAEVCAGTLDVTPLLGRRVGLDDVPAALIAARDASGPTRIVVVPGLGV